MNDIKPWGGGDGGGVALGAAILIAMPFIYLFGVGAGVIAFILAAWLLMVGKKSRP